MLNIGDSETQNSKVLLGRVKWFNNKAGFGFITITDEENMGNDIFVHHSAIKVLSEQYRYLVQGEYVEFTLIKMNEGKHEYQAGNICGVKGGKLMCETRKEFKNTRMSYKDSNNDSNNRTNDTGFNKENYNSRGEGPRASSEWTQIVRTKQKSNELNTNTNAEPGVKVPAKRGRKPKSELNSST